MSLSTDYLQGRLVFTSDKLHSLSSHKLDLDVLCEYRAFLQEAVTVFNALWRVSGAVERVEKLPQNEVCEFN